MNLIFNHIKSIMIIAGVITCSMIFAVFAPQLTLLNMFGQALNEPLAQIVVRSWGFLVFLMGALLIYGAFSPLYRNFTLVITSISKIVFIALLLIYGMPYLDKTIITMAIDSAFVLIFISYLIKVNRKNNTQSNSPQLTAK